MNRRLPVVVILVALVVGALVIDSTRDATVPARAPSLDDVAALPVASELTDRSSTWFCAGGTADEEAFADHVVIVANPADAAVEVALTVYAGVVLPPVVDPGAEELDPEADAGTETEADEAPTTTVPAVAPVQTVVAVAPYSRLEVSLAELVDAPIASAVVEAQAGGIVVEHQVSSVHGLDAKPCSTEASDQWHFAWGDTTVDARELLVLFNPFPDDAIVDGRFSTEDGVREPVRFDGLVVPGRGTIAVDLGDDVTRRSEVAATITARTGRIVVDRIVRVDAADRRGLTVQLGVPRPQTTWIFPDGLTSSTVTETYVVYNPTEELAEVEIELLVNEPDEHGIPEPVDLSLLPGTHETVDLTADGRIPEGLFHAAVVRSANGVPIVAERVLYAEGAARRGISVTTGSPVEAERWTFAAGSATTSSDEWLTVFNLDPEVIAEIDVAVLADGRHLPVADLQDIEIAALTRGAIRLGEYITRDAAVVITSSEPVVVERGLYPVGDDRGVSNAIGVPSPEGMRAPAEEIEGDVDADLGGGTGDEGVRGDGTDGTADDDIPVAPDDVEMPEPDQTIIVGDPEDEAVDPDATTSTTTTTSAPGAGESGSP